MNITTKYETGDIVYAVHPCKVIYGGQIILNHIRVHSPPLGAYKLIPNEVRLGRIPRSCKAGGKCQMAFEGLPRGSLLQDCLEWKIMAWVRISHIRMIFT
jgi:hypothetical protein